MTARPVRFLYALCNPAGLGPGSPDPNLRTLEPLNLAVERTIIVKAMRQLGEQGLDVDYHILDADDTGPVTIDAVRAALLGPKSFHVLHLLAHGGFMLRAGGGAGYKLIMENAQGGVQYVDTADFDVPMLGRDLRLVVLASCQSGNLNRDRAGERGEAFRALAPVLIERGVPAVIAMQDDMPIDAAQVFTERFYGDLARTGRVDMALSAARYALYCRDRTASTWAIPLLLLARAQGVKVQPGRLLAVDKARG